MKPETHKLGLVAAVIAPFFIAVSIIICNQAGKLTSPLVVAALGSLLSVPMLLGYHILRGAPLEFQKLRRDCGNEFLQVLISRTILGQVLIVSGFAMTTAVKAVLLLRLEPVFVLLWSVRAGQERLEPKKFAMLSILLTGTWLVVAPSEVSTPNIGDALIVLSLLFLSYSYEPTAKAVKVAGAPALNIALSFAGGLILLMVALIWQGPVALNVTPKALSLIAQYSFVFFVLACSLYFFAFNALRPWLIASLLSLEVVFGVVLAVIWIHETVTPTQIMGCMIVIVTTIAIARASNDRKHDLQSQAQKEVELIK